MAHEVALAMKDRLANMSGLTLQAAGDTLEAEGWVSENPFGNQPEQWIDPSTGAAVTLFHYQGIVLFIAA